MRHRKAGRKFGRSSSHRRAMFRNLVGNLFLNEKITTTDAKAKELRRIAERLITRAARLGDDLTVDIGKIRDDKKRERVIGRRIHAQRTVAAFVPKHLTKTHSDGSTEDVDVVYKLFHEIAPRFLERIKAGKGGGYTRITKLMNRRGDNAPMAILEILGGAAEVEEAEEEESSEDAA